MRHWLVRICGLVALGYALALGAVASAAAQSEAVTVDGIAGTWVKPQGATMAVLIIAGSGPTDRDGNNSLGIKTDAYKLLSEALAKEGVASLRFDKRGVGASKLLRNGQPFDEAAITIHSYAEDVAGLAAWLGKQPAIAKVALAGHSEGGLLALLAAKTQKVDRIVLLTAAGRPLGEVLRKQFDRQPMPLTMKEEIDRVIGVLEAGGDPGELKPPLNHLFRPSVQPFLKSVLALDPAPLVKSQAVPILVIGGGADLQIGRFDFNALSEARPGVKSRWEPRLTHVLKQEVDDDQAQQKVYSDPSLPLMTAITTEIVAFLKN